MIKQLEKLRDKQLEDLLNTLYSLEVMEGYQHTSRTTKLINFITTLEEDNK